MKYFDSPLHLLLNLLNYQYLQLTIIILQPFKALKKILLGLQSHINLLSTFCHFIIIIIPYIFYNQFVY